MEDSRPPMRLRFESRLRTLAKDVDYPDENQDVVRVDEEQGRAAIADGVSSSIFARQWARILVEAALSGPPDTDDRDALARWLADLRAAWSRQIDVSRLAWFQRPKLREGAFSTLLYVQLVPSALGAGLPLTLGAGLPTPPSEGPEVSGGEGDLRSADRRGRETCAERGGELPDASWRLQGLAIGDSCLFLVRDGSVVRKFPIQAAVELQSDPMVLGSVDLNRDERLSFHRIDEPCRPGDLVVLCTDAIADWALRQEESGSPPRWEDHWERPESAWREEILAMRAERQIRCDDATLGRLRITTALGAGLPTPPLEGPEVSDVAGDLRSTDRRGQETYAEREETCAQREPDEDWGRRIRAFSERAAEGLSQRLARGVEKIRRVRKAAQSKIKDYLDQLREDDR